MLIWTPVDRPGGRGSTKGQSSPQDLLLTLLHSVEKPLQLPRPLAVHKALPDAGVQAPGELREAGQGVKSQDLSQEQEAQRKQDWAPLTCPGARVWESVSEFVLKGTRLEAPLGASK